MVKRLSLLLTHKNRTKIRLTEREEKFKHKSLTVEKLILLSLVNKRFQKNAFFLHNIPMSHIARGVYVHLKCNTIEPNIECSGLLKLETKNGDDFISRTELVPLNINLLICKLNREKINRNVLSNYCEMKT